MSELKDDEEKVNPEQIIAMSMCVSKFYMMPIGRLKQMIGLLEKDSSSESKQASALLRAIIDYKKGRLQFFPQREQELN